MIKVLKLKFHRFLFKLLIFWFTKLCHTPIDPEGTVWNVYYLIQYLYLLLNNVDSVVLKNLLNMGESSISIFSY